MSDEITITLSRADAKALKLLVLRYAKSLGPHFHPLCESVSTALAALAEGAERAATGETGEALAFTVNLTYDDYGSFDHVLTEAISALESDADLWDRVRPQRAEGDRESIAFANRLLGALYPMAQAFFAEEIAQRREEGRKLMEQKLAELRAAGEERGA